MTPHRPAHRDRHSGLLARSTPFLLALIWALSMESGTPSGATGKPVSVGGWPEITAEERSLRQVPQDPEADAVILNNERYGKLVKLADDTVNVLNYHWRAKILNERGKRFGEIHIRAQKFSRVSNIQARTIRPDGTVVPVAPDQIFEKVILQVGDLKLTEWVFNFPAVEPGAIIEYRYDRHDNLYFFIDPWFFEGEEFTLHSRVTQGVPAGMGYMILCDLCEGTKPEISNWREGKQQGQLYTLEMRNLPGYREEILMPPQREVSPRLEMVLQSWRDVYWKPLGRQDRLFTDWGSVARWAKYSYDEAVKAGQPSLKPVVDQWVQGILDPQEKLKAVFRHVQLDFRYIPYTNVIGGTRSIASMLRDRSADNEEKAVLLMAALKAIGVDSYADLVSGKDKGSLNPKFFSLSQFTHGVVALPSPDGSVKILDPTASYTPFGFLPWRDSGADILSLKSDQGENGTLPIKNELSTTKYRVTVRPRADGKADLDLEARYVGEDAQDEREELTPASESGRNENLQAWLKRQRPGAVLISHSIENLEQLEEPLLIRMKVEATAMVTVAEGVLAVRGCVFSCYDSNPIRGGTRQHPFYVDRGWNEEETVVILSPDGMEPSTVPPPVSAKSSIGSLMFSCVSHDLEGVNCSRFFAARRNRWSSAEYDGVRTMFDKIVEADRTAVTFATKSVEGK